MEQTVVPVIGDVKIIPAVVIVVAHANALAPARGLEPGGFRDIGERPIVIIVVKMIRRRVLSRRTLQRGSVHQENVRPSVIVIIEDRYSRAGSFDDELLGLLPAKNVERE